ncbi:hypothetical protein RN001_011974 [Aquatica leii]|uniref:Osiris 2 n=1 Tax=Aquatica leii TaxID=1421715 RepID=A0AAN7SD33_9COLE|nr:hypothetical protein RN001_011974 [Aquatica leii]
MLGCAKWLFLTSAVSLVALHSAGEERIGKDLLDWIGLGTGPNVDPYLSRANEGCLNGDLAECFKSRALQSLDDFFNQPVYHLTENAKILRMPETQLRQLASERFEYSELPRSDEPEWDQLVKFGMRRIEKFLKSTGIEVSINNDVTENGRYSPRFIDEIADEIDIIEDKKDSYFKRKQLKKLFIPMLIILKLFKLKLLLFLPLILGLASFKKLLGFIAIIIPGLIGFFKLCKPDLHSSFGHNNYYSGPHYSPAGIGYQPHFKDYDSTYSRDYNNYYEGSRGGVAFEDNRNHAQNLAYSGYSNYRNSPKDIKADETSSKKSILPDS